jgi:hypothetical protein
MLLLLLYLASLVPLASSGLESSCREHLVVFIINVVSENVLGHLRRTRDSTPCLLRQRVDAKHTPQRRHCCVLGRPARLDCACLA